jgi:hypothetical protein
MAEKTTKFSAAAKAMVQAKAARVTAPPPSVRAKAISKAINAAAGKTIANMTRISNAKK